jgi:broad specificity phosphatase PhoE
VSDLFCAATLVLARHGDAEYVEDWFSDEGGSLTPEGRQQSVALADALTGRRVARVWASDTSRAVQTAEIVAARLGLAGERAVTAHKSLREMAIGDLLGGPFDLDRLHAVTDRWFAGDLQARFPGGESGADVVARLEGALRSIADEHRGETVLVVAHEMATAVTLHALTGHRRMLENGGHIEVLADADGWQLVDP